MKVWLLTDFNLKKTPQLVELVNGGNDGADDDALNSPPGTFDLGIDGEPLDLEA